MTKISFVEKIKFEKSDAIVLIRAVKNGINIFLYLKSNKQQYLQLQSLCESGNRVEDLSQFGEVIMYGEDQPNEETRKFIDNFEV